MTSRHLLWIVLGVVTLPLFFEATSGCDIVFSLDRVPINDNALQCACSCSGASSRGLAVLASSDDAEQSGATMDLMNPELTLGTIGAVGVRFDGIKIPPGATIQSAYVQFTGGPGRIRDTSLTIVAEASTTAATFSPLDSDLTNRMAGSSTVAWMPDTWADGETGAAAQTPDLAALVQELVDLPGWSSGSAIVLRFAGTGERVAQSFDGDPASAPTLVVNFESTVATTLPVCALAGDAHDSLGALTPEALVDECSRVQSTLTGLAGACGYPSTCTCGVVDVPDQDDSFDSDVCSSDCTETPVDATCSNYDPAGFSACLAAGGTVDDCKESVGATNAPGGSPVCVASGSPLAFHAFGHRSQCEVDGLSHIKVGNREPKHDPDTRGIVEFLGGPCPGGGCSIYPYFDLHMDSITFDVKWHSDPTFSDLSASGRGLETAVLDGSGQASFPPGTIGGTGNGRRGSDGLAVNAANFAPLGFGIDWLGRTCTMNGALDAAVDGEVPDGTCQGDGTTVCTADSPDCDDVGGPCVFEDQDIEQMTVDVALTGTLVNQPPRAVAVAPPTVECTSPDGAEFWLDGGGSSDPDGNLALASWRRGTRVGPLVADSLRSLQMLGVGESEDYFLRVIDGFAQSDEDEATVAVVDTTPPELTVAVSPDTLWPPNHKLVPITATIGASDVCDPNPSVRLLSITSNEPDDGLGDGDTPGDVSDASFGTDDRVVLLRAERSGTGEGRVYTITYEASDESGNTTIGQATVIVPH